jgi:hypothetical protein
MRILCWIILLIGAPYCAAAQSAVQINEEPLVTNLIKNWTQANRNNPRVSGWRVQILSTNDRAQADATRNQFRTQYPELPAEWTHERPYYRVRVGACKTRIEAMHLISEINALYPGCFPALDPNIHPRDFLR